MGEINIMGREGQREREKERERERETERERPLRHTNISSRKRL